QGARGPRAAGRVPRRVRRRARHGGSRRRAHAARGARARRALIPPVFPAQSPRFARTRGLPSRYVSRGAPLERPVKTRFPTIVIVLVLLGAASAGATGARAPGEPRQRPLAFEANRGQSDPQVRFVARG